MSTASHTWPPSPPPPPAPGEDPFRYGWRDIVHMRPDGHTVERIPLTLDDVLHPREGDVIPLNTLHHIECNYLYSTAELRVAGRAGVLLTGDLLIDWGPDGPRDHAPDFGVIFNVADIKKKRGKFYVVREGTRPRMLLEVVSPDTRNNDVVEKFREYHQVRVPIYVIVDQKTEDGPREIKGYSWAPQGYELMPLDKNGRLYLEPLDLLLGLQDGRVYYFDPATGERIGDYVEVAQALAAAEQRTKDLAQEKQDAEKRAKDAEKRASELEAELRKLRGQT